MGLDYQNIINKNQNQFKSLISEKHKLIRKISSTKYTIIFIITAYTIFKFFPDLLEDYSLYTSAIISISIISSLSLIIIASKNESFLTSNNIKKLKARFKSHLVLSLIKSISDKLEFTPIQKVSASIIKESKLMQFTFSNIKGGNLIHGKFSGIEIQGSEIILFNKSSKKFQGLFFYINGISEKQIIKEDLKKISNYWKHTDNKLFIAIPKKKRQFHLNLKESNKSFKQAKSDLNELLIVFQAIHKMTRIEFESSFEAAPLEEGAFDDVYGRKHIYSNLSTNNQFVLASSSKRILHYIIDPIIILLTAIAVALIMKITKPEFLLIYFISIYLIYYISLEYFCFQTIGKVLTKSKVISTSGTKPSFSQICIRTVCRLIPYEQFSYINNNVVLHDKLSKTIVIDLEYNKPLKS